MLNTDEHSSFELIDVGFRMKPPQVGYDPKTKRFLKKGDLRPEPVFLVGYGPHYDYQFEKVRAFTLSGSPVWDSKGAINTDSSFYCYGFCDVDDQWIIPIAIEETGSLDSVAVEKEVVAVARNMVAENPQIRAILLECSLLPPYGAAVQAAVNLPVFDYITMINFVFRPSSNSRTAGICNPEGK